MRAKSAGREDANMEAEGAIADENAEGRSADAAADMVANG